MSTIEIILLIIALAEVAGATLTACLFVRSGKTEKKMEALQSDVRFQRDVAQSNYKNWEKAHLANQILLQKIDGSAYETLKKDIKKKLSLAEKCESKDKYDDGRRDVLNELVFAIEAWENQNESDS